ncbi:MAG: hypothetical protein LBS20_09630 [Prevotella sp.]|jgi:hypothetical protein|nr:hypothetical protein [Prevotella sp.]
MEDKDVAVKMCRDLLKGYKKRLFEECSRFSSDEEKLEAAVQSAVNIIECLRLYAPSPLDYKVPAVPPRWMLKGRDTVR